MFFFFWDIYKNKFACVERINFVAQETMNDHDFAYDKASFLNYLKIGSPALNLFVTTGSWLEKKGYTTGTIG